MDTGAECTLLYENPEKFLGPEASTDDYGGHSVKMKAVQLSLGIRHLHPVNILFIYPSIPEYILGIDVLQELWLYTTTREFCLKVRVVKAILRGHANHSPIWLLPPRWVTTVKPYRLPWETQGNYGNCRRVGKGGDN